MKLVFGDIVVVEKEFIVMKKWNGRKQQKLQSDRRNLK